MAAAKIDNRAWWNPHGLRPRKTKVVETVAPVPEKPATKKRKAATTAAVVVHDKPAKKKRRVTKTKKAKIVEEEVIPESLLLSLPREILCSILRQCNSKTRRCFSGTSEYCRDLALQMQWEVVRVDVNKRNLDMIDFYEDLRPSIRRMDLRVQSLRHEASMKSAVRRMAGHISKGYYAALQEIHIEFFTSRWDHLSQLMKALNDNRPKNLRKVTLMPVWRYSGRRRSSQVPPPQPNSNEIPYVSGVKDIEIRIHSTTWDMKNPLHFLQHNADTVENLKVCLSRWNNDGFGRWWKEMNGVVFPKLKKLVIENYDGKDDGFRNLHIQAPALEEYQATWNSGLWGSVSHHLYLTHVKSLKRVYFALNQSRYSVNSNWFDVAGMKKGAQEIIEDWVKGGMSKVPEVLFTCDNYGDNPMKVMVVNVVQPGGRGWEKMVMELAPGVGGKQEKVTFEVENDGWTAVIFESKIDSDD